MWQTLNTEGNTSSIHKQKAGALTRNAFLALSRRYHKNDISSILKSRCFLSFKWSKYSKVNKSQHKHHSLQFWARSKKNIFISILNIQNKITIYENATPDSTTGMYHFLSLLKNKNWTKTNPLMLIIAYHLEVVRGWCKPILLL